MPMTPLNCQRPKGLAPQALRWRPAVLALLASPLLVLAQQPEPEPQQAQPPLYTEDYGRCLERADAVNAEIIDCMAKELAVQDGRLNTHYQALRAQLSAPRKAQLKHAQRLWLQYRDAHCEFLFDPNGGTITRLLANDCTLRETALRAQELQGLAETGLFEDVSSSPAQEAQPGASASTASTASTAGAAQKAAQPDEAGWPALLQQLRQRAQAQSAAGR
ncbi:lysozyme inhibitor LprI family protein [Vandammella animalimorsus]|uniref:lysozyme inhibitor LprI family protein n=1 Tax=Vandammella animalimorsus TaxID=2029117 RepID=UPI00325AAE67